MTGCGVITFRGGKRFFLSTIFLPRHTCFTLDFIEGSTKLFENGRIYFEKSGIEDIKKTYEVIAKQIDIVSVG